MAKIIIYFTLVEYASLIEPFETVLRIFFSIITTFIAFALSLFAALYAIRYKENREIKQVAHEFMFYLGIHKKAIEQQTTLSRGYFDELVSMDSFISPIIQRTTFPIMLIESSPKNKFIEYFRREKHEHVEAAISVMVSINLAIEMIERYERQCIKFSENVNEIADSWNSNISKVHDAIRETHASLPESFDGSVEDKTLDFILRQYQNWVTSKSKGLLSVLDLFIFPVDEKLREVIQSEPNNKYADILMKVLQSQHIIHNQFISLKEQQENYINRYTEQLEEQKMKLENFLSSIQIK